MIELLFVTSLAVGQGSVAAPPAAAQGCRPSLSMPGAVESANGSGSSPGNGASARPTGVDGTLATFLVPPPPEYVVGVDDVLTIRFWREDTMSSEVVVRTDGKISLPLINELDAVGLTPLELCSRITEAARQFVQGPAVSVIVKQINSRKVYISGMVGRSGSFPITGPMTLMQLVALAGGLQDYADAKNILVVRMEGGKQLSYKINYEDLTKGRNLGQNILLKPGDTVHVR